MTYKVLIDAPRVYVRTWLKSDVQAIHQIMSQKQVHTFTEEEPWSLTESQDLIDWCTSHQHGWTPGYFNCPIILRDEDRLIGRVGLNPFDLSARIPEIEWTIDPDCWGQGYASEIGRAVVRYGLHEASFPAIEGFTRPQHVAARQLMQAVGMNYVGEREHDGNQFSFYRVDTHTLDSSLGASPEI